MATTESAYFKTELKVRRERLLEASQENAGDGPKPGSDQHPGDQPQPGTQPDQTPGAGAPPAGPASVPAPTTLVSLPDGSSATARTPALAQAVKAHLAGTPVEAAYRAAGIGLPPPGTPVTNPVDPSSLSCGAIGVFKDHYVVALSSVKAYQDGQVVPLGSVASSPDFLGWIDEPRALYVPAAASALYSPSEWPATTTAFWRRATPPSFSSTRSTARECAIRAGWVFSVRMSSSPGPSNIRRESFCFRVSSTSSNTSRAAEKAPARSRPMPTAWLPWPGKMKA